MPLPISESELQEASERRRRAMDHLAVQQFLSEAELSRRANRPPQAIRALREQGMVTPIGRTSAGTYLYEQTALTAVLAEGMQARGSACFGMPSRFVREYLARVGTDHPTSCLRI